MKKIWKWLGVLCTTAMVGGMIAEVLDVIRLRKEEKQAKKSGVSVHKPYGIYERYFKRAFDFFFSSLALIGLSPILLVTTALVRVKLGSPVLFIQKRPGKNEKIFSIYKFRTMTDKRDKEGNLLPDEERLTGFGKMLRSTSLDELPELVNILKGDMSIVGPRPLLVEYLPYYTETERHRHDVRPGLTGFAQVNGRNSISWEKRFEWDLKYLKRITFLSDMKIVFLTIRKVIRRSDILVGEQQIEGRLDIDRGTELEGVQNNDKDVYK